MVFSTFVSISIENYLPDWSNNSGGPIIQFYSEKSNKNFQPNLGSGQTSQIDLDFNKGKKPVIKSLSADIPGTCGTSTRYRYPVPYHQGTGTIPVVASN